MKYVKEFRYGDELIALLVTKEFRNRRPTDHATFVSADNQSLQLGVGHYPNVMKGGDTVHLISGGHGFKMLSPCKCIEIKQGPYQGWNNKKVF